jgi:hypothetical protein
MCSVRRLEISLYPWFENFHARAPTIVVRHNVSLARFGYLWWGLEFIVVSDDAKSHVLGGFFCPEIVHDVDHCRDAPRIPTGAVDFPWCERRATRRNMSCAPSRLSDRKHHERHC